MQIILNEEQISSFYHDEFVEQQVMHFKEIAVKNIEPGKVIVDIGGGCGFFAQALQEECGFPVRVIDTDLESVEKAKKIGVVAELGNALSPVKKGDEGIICFNLILHHLVSRNEVQTRSLQIKAILNWRNPGQYIFINEYIYDSWLNDFSGWLIYKVTSSNILSNIASIVAKVVPSLKANTFGVGVRFRSGNEWRRLFCESGFEVVDEIKGDEEYISFPRRLLLIKSIRRDSFLLTVSR